MTEAVSQPVAGVKLRALRISNRSLEFDLFADSDAAVDQAIRALQPEFGRLLTKTNLSAGELTRGLISIPQLVRRAVVLFNEERFWESQETLEVAWNRVPRGTPERDVLQGVILVGAAFVHHQKAEDAVCRSMLRRALTHIKRHPRLAQATNFHGLDVKDLVSKCRHVLRTGRVSLLKFQSASADIE